MTRQSANAPRISVVTALFDAEPFIAETIESVLAQDYGDFEYLLVDDGSTDGSTGIAKNYQRKHPDLIRYLEHPGHANRGAAASRNFGIGEARGELIAILDADDRWAPQKLREQVDILDRYPEVDAVCGTARYWQSWEGGEDALVPSGHAHNRPVRPPEAVVAVWPLGRTTAPCPSDLLMRRRAIEAIGGFEEGFTGPLQLYEDQAFLTKFYLRNTFYFSDKVWLDYRVHDQSCVAQTRRAGRRDEVRRHFLEWLESYLGKTRHRNDLRIRMALARALFRYRHPTARRVLNVPRRIGAALLSPGEILRKSSVE
jgi:glycosyltransferase involved in cell wall biosynthesis